MNKILNVIISSFILFSCAIKPEKSPKTGIENIVGIYIKSDSSKQLAILMREIVKTVKYDSSTKKDNIIIDTLWAYPTYLLEKDSTGEAKTYYTLINKDSVNWKIQGISIDSLLKNED